MLSSIPWCWSCWTACQLRAPMPVVIALPSSARCPGLLFFYPTSSTEHRIDCLLAISHFSVALWCFSHSQKISGSTVVGLTLRWGSCSFDSHLHSSKTRCCFRCSVSTFKLMLSRETSGGPVISAVAVSYCHQIGCTYDPCLLQSITYSFLTSASHSLWGLVNQLFLVMSVFYLTFTCNYFMPNFDFFWLNPYSVLRAFYLILLAASALPITFY